MERLLRMQLVIQLTFSKYIDLLSETQLFSTYISHMYAMFVKSFPHWNGLNTSFNSEIIPKFVPLTVSIRTVLADSIIISCSNDSKVAAWHDTIWYDNSVKFDSKSVFLIININSSSLHSYATASTSFFLINDRYNRTRIQLFRFPYHKHILIAIKIPVNEWFARITKHIAISVDLIYISQCETSLQK